MADSRNYEEILADHRKERNELMAESQRAKHSIPKGDKSKKKEVTAQFTKLMADLDLKQQVELSKFDLTSGLTRNGNNPNENVEESVSHAENSAPEPDGSGANKNIQARVSKAQKRRNKKAQSAKERQEAIAEQEVENLSGARHIELVEIRKKLAARNLTIHEVPSDGNCLYKAIEHQLSTLCLQETTVTMLREGTSKHLLSHKDEYINFITNPEGGDLMTDEQYQKYCDDIVNTTVWGGQIEVQALSSVCQKPIEVIQADGPSIISGDECMPSRLLISYHRHAFGLGEHYNSVVPIKTEGEDCSSKSEVCIS